MHENYNLDILKLEIDNLYMCEWKIYQYYQKKLDYLIKSGFPLSSLKMIQTSKKMEDHLFKVIQLKNLLHKKYYIKLRDLQI